MDYTYTSPDVLHGTSTAAPGTKRSFHASNDDSSRGGGHSDVDDEEDDEGDSGGYIVTAGGGGGRSQSQRKRVRSGSRSPQREPQRDQRETNGTPDTLVSSSAEGSAGLALRDAVTSTGPSDQPSSR